MSRAPKVSWWLPVAAVAGVAALAAWHLSSANPTTQVLPAVLPIAGQPPGNDFGTYRAQHHLRFSYTTSITRIEEALERMTVLLA